MTEHLTTGVERAERAVGHDHVMRSVAETLSALQQSIVGLTAQLHDMKKPNKADAMDGHGTHVPWALTLEERYPVNSSANYSEFERKYPPDRFGDEAADHARVWKVYRDRASELDQNKIDVWNKTLDILLIFAGLFSAVVSAFLIQAYQLLQQDYSQYLAFAFYAAQINTTIPNPAEFAAPGTAVWTNGLWFSSLVLSLTVALLAILSKQWLEEYGYRMRAHVASHRHWAWRHLAYSAGLTKWHIDGFISTLPFLLHVAVFLFFSGLGIFLWRINRAIAIAIATWTSILLVLYFLAVLAPLAYGDCPSATPLLRHMYAAYRNILGGLHRALEGATSLPPATQGSIEPNTFWRTPTRFISRRILAIRRAMRSGVPMHRPAAFAETRVLRARSIDMDVHALSWMVTNLPADVEVAVALDCIGSLDIDTHLSLIRQHDIGYITDACILNFLTISRSGAAPDEIAVARCLRTMAFLGLSSASHAPQDALWNACSGWNPLQTYDIFFLASALTNIGDIAPFMLDQIRSAPRSRVVLPSTLRLLLPTALHVADLIGLLACGLCGFSASQFPDTMHRALSAVVDQLELQISKSRNVALLGDAEWRPIPRSEHVVLRTLYLCGFLLVHMQDPGYLLVEVLCATIAIAEHDFPELNLHSLPLFENVLWYVGTEDFGRRTWSDVTINQLGSVMWCAIADVRQGFTWTTEFEHIWRQWMLQYRPDNSHQMGEQTAHMMESISLHLGYNEATVNRTLAEEMLDMLRRPPTSDTANPTSIHEQEGEMRSLSTWRMAFQIGFHAGPASFCRIAGVLSGALVARRNAADIEDLWEDLVGHGIGVEMITEMITSRPDDALHFARNGRAISEEWWRTTSTMLMVASAHTWETVGRYESHGMFVDAVEGV